jgi:outer membrane protein TolC
VDDARRAVENAKNQLLPDFNFAGRVGFPTDPHAREGGVAFQPEDLNYQAGVTFGLPLDREQERLSLRAATISLEQRIREYSRSRDTVAVGVRQAVRNIDLARFQLRLAEARVRVNEQRVEELRLKSDEVDTQTQVDAANNLQDSRSALERARTALRNAILNYLRDSGVLRVRRDGTFEAIPGMDQPPAPPPAPAPPPPSPVP